MRGPPGDGDSDDDFAQWQWHPDYPDSICPYCSLCSEYGHGARECPWVWNELKGWHKLERPGSSWSWSVGCAAIAYFLLAIMLHSPQRTA